MATDARKHTSPAGGETPRRQSINDLSLSINDPVPIANPTERTQLVTDLAALTPSYIPSAARPLYVDRADAPAGQTIERTINGTDWAPVNSGEFVGATAAMVGTAPPAGTLLKRRILNGIVSSGSAGRVLVSYGYTFPNGVVAVTATLVNGDSLGAWINLWGPPTLTGVTLQLMSGTSAVANANMRYCVVVEGW